MQKILVKTEYWQNVPFRLGLPSELFIPTNLDFDIGICLIKS